MTSKALILGIVLTISGVLQSNAVVYSRNVVGYVNMQLPAGLCILANPLHGAPDNSLNTTLKLSDPQNIGASIFRWDETNQAFRAGILWIGTGWFPQDGDLDSLVLAPGEAFFIQLFEPESIRWHGETPEGPHFNPIPGNGRLSLRASQIPTEDHLGFPGKGLEFPAANFDTVFLFDCATQSYIPWQFFDQVGWFNALDPLNNCGPIIPPGTGFFIQKMDNGIIPWTRTYTVGN